MPTANSVRTARPLLASAALVAAASLATAQTCPIEAPLQNWSGGGTVACPCFVPGEEAGAILNAPPEHFPIEITRIQIGWGSASGGQPDSLEQSIHVYENALPNPGAPIFSLDGPVLVDGFINDFDIEFLPGEVIVNDGPFIVSLEFANTSAGDPFQPAAVHDGAGCQPGKSAVKAIPGGWFDNCTLGVTGQWVFTVEYRRVDCADEIGTRICTASSVPNSTGLPGVMTVTGSEIVADDDLTLAATQLPTNSNIGYFIMGTGVNTFVPPGSVGPICVAPGIKRYLPPVNNTNQLPGGFSRVVGTTGPVSGNITPGSLWTFQAWHRDSMAGTSNLTDAVLIVFQ